MSHTPLVPSTVGGKRRRPMGELHRETPEPSGRYRKSRCGSGLF
jgi:hypothetical protein